MGFLDIFKKKGKTEQGLGTQSGPDFASSNSYGPYSDQYPKTSGYGRYQGDKNSQNYELELPPLPPFKDHLTPKKSMNKEEKEFNLPDLDEFDTSKNMEDKMEKLELPEMPSFKSSQFKKDTKEPSSFKEFDAPSYEEGDDFDNSNMEETNEEDGMASYEMPKPVSRVKIPETKAKPYVQSIKPERQSRSLMPPSMPDEPSRGMTYAEGPIYVNISEYKALIDQVTEVNTTIMEMEHTANRIVELESARRAKMKEVHEHIEDLERNLILIDKTLFER